MMTLTSWSRSAWLLLCGLALSGCVVDVDAAGNGGSGGQGGDGGQGAAGGQGGSGAQGGGGQGGGGQGGSNPGACTSHDDCPGALCVFSTGQCAITCDSPDDCGAGEVCNECATSSCYACADCVAACVPADGKCDDHDDCPDGVCIWGTGQCAPACGPSGCPEGMVCGECVTSSCPLCLDCWGACVAKPPAECDSIDDCPQGKVCLLSAGTCVPGCLPGNTCADPNAVCDECATSSCGDCDDCIGICAVPR